MEWLRLLLWVWGKIKEEKEAQLKPPDVAKHGGITVVELEGITMGTETVTNWEDKPEKSVDMLHLEIVVW